MDKGCGGEIPLVWSRDMAATSMECDRFSCLMNCSLRGGSALLLPQCAASIDWLSSMGVKMLCLADACRGRGCGSGGLWKSLCCGGDGTVMVGCSGRSCCAWETGCG
jgi:hypothetical protein